MIRIFIFISLLGFTSFANASNWILIGQGGGSEITYYIDQASIVKSGALVKYWSKTVRANPRAIENEYPAKFYSYSVALELANCASRTSATKQITYYESDGGFVTGYSYPMSRVHFDEVVPDSLGEAALNRICSPKKHRKNKHSHTHHI